MLYDALILQLLAFVARTKLNREHLRYPIVVIHCNTGRFSTALASFFSKVAAILE